MLQLLYLPPQAPPSPGKVPTSRAKSLFYWKKRCSARLFFQRGYRNIWFSLFFSPAAPRRPPTTTGPENPVSLLGKWRKKTKCIYSRAEKKAAQSSVFFNKKETLLLKWALSQGNVVVQHSTISQDPYLTQPLSLVLGITKRCLNFNSDPRSRTFPWESSTVKFNHGFAMRRTKYKGCVR